MNPRLQPVTNVCSVVLGECEYVATPFAIPVHAGAACADFLDLTGGRLPDIESVAKVLHHQAHLGSDTQGFYLFPRVIDTLTLAQLLQPHACATIAEAMVADVMETSTGAPSRLTPLIPAPSFQAAPLMFLLGAVFMDPLCPDLLQLSRPGWWARSQVRQDCESMFCGQFAELGIPTTISPMPVGACELHDALRDGIVEFLTNGQQDSSGDLEVKLQDAKTVSISMTSATRSQSVSLPLRALGEAFVEDLINAVAVRSRYQTPHPVH